MPRVKIAQDEIFSAIQEVNIPTSNEPLDNVILRLIGAGFSNEEILNKTFPTHDASRSNPRRESFLSKIQRLRDESQQAEE